ncbi:MAG: ATP-binding protein [Legionella sp.]|uniref:ATP-binding protein n=1 Tax=Legionella sp. TaxID=459 RepID=UPI0039E6B711
MANTNKQHELEIRQLKNKIDFLENQLFEKKQKNKFLDNLIALIPGHIYWLNTKNEFLGCNNMQAKTAQLNSRHEIVGKTNSDMPWKNQADELNKINNLVMQSGKIQIREETVDTIEGKKTYLSHKEPLRDENQNIIGMLGVSLDISQIKKLESELRDAKEAAEIANKAKTEFIANMSHDIRTPLTGVIGLSEILEHTLRDPEDQKKAHMLHDSGEELLHMLNNILDDVRAEHLSEQNIKHESFDLHQCIHDLIRLESPATSVKHLILKADIAPDVPRYVCSDRDKIHRILLNLLGNAIKFTQSGSITLSLECLHQNAATAHIKFAVSDTGIGIPEEVQSQVFNRFFKVSSSYKGVYTGHGLGLHIAQSYVALLGGHITLTSKVGEGSTFHFDVECPISEAPSSSTKSHAFKRTNQSVSTQTPLHFLLVEDNVIALKTLEMMLEKNGYAFVSATTGEEAWTLLQTSSVDLIITDIGLPGISGTELAQRIRHQEQTLNRPAVPIIALTGHAKEAAWEECQQAGINDVLSKPTQIETIEQCLHQILPMTTSAPQSPNQSAKKSLGQDLPDTEEALFQLDAFPLFDEHQALEQIHDEDLLITLVQTYLSDEIQKDIHQIQSEHQKNNWHKVEELAHKIKGGVVYMGTAKMRYACQYLERYYKAGHRSLLEPLYQQLLRVNEHTINELNQWLKRKN